MGRKSVRDREPIPGAEGTEGGRSGPTVVPSAPGKAAGADPQVIVGHQRRRLSVAFKRRVVIKVRQLRGKGFGAIGSYLRGVGVYYSSVRLWDRQEKAGTLGAARGAKEQSRESLHLEIRRLRHQLEVSERKLQQSELIIELQKKIADMAALSQLPSFERSK